jgi:hypothetical protein
MKDDRVILEEPCTEKISIAIFHKSNLTFVFPPSGRFCVIIFYRKVTRQNKSNKSCLPRSISKNGAAYLTGVNPACPTFPVKCLPREIFVALISLGRVLRNCSPI